MYICVVQCKINHGIDRVPLTKYKDRKATVWLPTLWASTTYPHAVVWCTDRKICVHYNRMFMDLLCTAVSFLPWFMHTHACSRDQ